MYMVVILKILYVLFIFIPQLFADPYLHFLPTQLFKRMSVKINLCFPNTLKCITSHWSMTGLPGAIGKGPVFLSKTDCLSRNIYQ